MAFTRTAKRRDVHKGDLDPTGNDDLFPFGRVPREREDLSPISLASKRDLNKVVRSERAVRHTPLDVEIARALVVDQFPSRHSRFR
jgi:hypothetical protein